MRFLACKFSQPFEPKGLPELFYIFYELIMIVK